MYLWNNLHLAPHIQHQCDSNSLDNNDLRLAVEACAEKAISLLDDNINDDSLYLLFEWNADKAELNVCVTDASKQHDSKHQVIMHFAALANKLHSLPTTERLAKQHELSESVQFWLHDYLTTCTAFFRYSLVAIFHKGSRANTELL